MTTEKAIVILERARDEAREHYLRFMYEEAVDTQDDIIAYNMAIDALRQSADRETIARSLTRFNDERPLCMYSRFDSEGCYCVLHKQFVGCIGGRVRGCEDYKENREKR